MTSVLGHVMNHCFDNAFNGWSSCDPFALFDAPVALQTAESFIPVERNLINEARRSDTLMIWTDCDREGEGIGVEIAHICQKGKPNITVRRARFSAIIPQCVQFSRHI
jgi:DNA topoisomerase-3